MFAGVLFAVNVAVLDERPAAISFKSIAHDQIFVQRTSWLGSRENGRQVFLRLLTLGGRCVIDIGRRLVRHIRFGWLVRSGGLLLCLLCDNGLCDRPLRFRLPSASAMRRCGPFGACSGGGWRGASRYEPQTSKAQTKGSRLVQTIHIRWSADLQHIISSVMMEPHTQTRRRGRAVPQWSAGCDGVGTACRLLVTLEPAANDTKLCPGWAII